MKKSLRKVRCPGIGCGKLVATLAEGLCADCRLRQVKCRALPGGRRCNTHWHGSPLPIFPKSGLCAEGIEMRNKKKHLASMAAKKMS